MCNFVSKFFNGHARANAKYRVWFKDYFDIGVRLQTARKHATKTGHGPQKAFQMASAGKVAAAKCEQGNERAGTKSGAN